MFTLNGINDDIKMIESLVKKNKENISVEDFERFFGFMEYLKKDIKIFTIVMNIQRINILIYIKCYAKKGRSWQQ